MITLIKDWTNFSRLWRKFERYANSEGIEDENLFKALAGCLEIKDGARVAGAMQNWLMNRCSDEDRLAYTTCFLTHQDLHPKEEEEDTKDHEVEVVDFNE